MTDRAPWRCPDCGGVIAPHVDVHFCGNEPDGGSLAKLPVRPQAPPMASGKSPEPAAVATGGAGGVSSGTWTYPPGTVVAPGVTYGGGGAGGAGGTSAFITYGGPGGGGTGNAT